MKTEITEIEWKVSVVKNNFLIKNSKAYHKADLIPSLLKDSISYITRTNLNNGLEDFVIDNKFITNKKNTIVFGAENAKFFYQHTKYITGNKMYYIENSNINKYNGIFLQLCFDNSIKGAGFGYGKGLTGTRFINRKVLLPLNIDGFPEYDFMEKYSKEIFKRKQKAYLDYIGNRLNELNEINKPTSLKDKKWKIFKVIDIFNEIQRGKRLKKDDHIKGDIPYSSSTSLNNGIDDFIGNKNNVRIFGNCLTIANSGSVGCTFYQPFNVIASDHVTMLKNINFNKYIYLFLAHILTRLNEKYSFNREINDKRLSKEKILLPINSDDLPDYEYMENFMKYYEYTKLKEYLDFKQKKL